MTMSIEGLQDAIELGHLCIVENEHADRLLGWPLVPVCEPYGPALPCRAVAKRRGAVAPHDAVEVQAWIRVCDLDDVGTIGVDVIRSEHTVGELQLQLLREGGRVSHRRLEDAWPIAARRAASGIGGTAGC